MEDKIALYNTQFNELALAIEEYGKKVEELNLNEDNIIRSGIARATEHLQDLAGRERMVLWNEKQEELEKLQRDHEIEIKELNTQHAKEIKVFEQEIKILQTQNNDLKETYEDLKDKYDNLVIQCSQGESLEDILSYGENLERIARLKKKSSRSRE